jgi:DNA-3-methyladenine glycosylase
VGQRVKPGSGGAPPDQRPRRQTLNAERQMKAIDRTFFKTDPVTCAQLLIGCELVWGETAGLIVETEAYAEHDDQASHSFLRRGTRKFIETYPPGTLYVYLNYGVHWLLNFLVKGKSANGFVLIRALEPTGGCELMAERRGGTGERMLCSGPGKLTQALAIDGAFHGRDFFQISGVMLLHRGRPVSIESDRRVGITKSMELDWRFLQAGSVFVSAPKKTRLRAN